MANERLTTGYVVGGDQGPHGVCQIQQESLVNGDQLEVCIQVGRRYFSLTELFASSVKTSTPSPDNDLRRSPMEIHSANSSPIREFAIF